MDLHTLNAKVWYRLLKVVFGVAFLAVVTLWLLLVALEYPPAYSFAKDRSTIVCTTEGKPVYVLGGLGSLLYRSEPSYEKTQTDEGIYRLDTTPAHEIATYFRNAGAPGTLDAMPDHVRETLRLLCGLNPYESNGADARLRDARSKHLLTMSEVAESHTFADWWRSNGNQQLPPKLLKQMESILQNSQIPDEAKAQAWDAFIANGKPEDFKKAFDGIQGLPNPLKLQLAELRFGQAAGERIADALVSAVPETFQVVHLVPELSMVNRQTHNFVFEDISGGPIIDRRAARESRNGYRPSVAVLYLGHDGGWPHTLLIAMLGILAIALFFEVTRRVFYYVAIGTFRP